MAEDRSQIRVWKIIGVVFLIWALASTTGLAYYYNQFSTTEQALTELRKRVEATTISVALIIDYGNGTAYRRRHMDITAIIGDTLFTLTMRLASVNYTKYAIGVFITAIDGVQGNSTHAWLWYRWDLTAKAWVLGEVGADAYTLKDGDILIWYYTSFVTWPPKPPEPPT